MSMWKKDEVQQNLYAPDDAIFRTREPEAMQLPEDPMEYFSEEQSFSQIWLWILLGLETVAVMLPLLILHVGILAMLISGFAMVCSLALLSALKLNSRIDDEGIHYQMKVFHWKERTIPWADIDQVYVRSYSPIREYGGWGLRFGLQGRAVTVKGTYGIQIVLKNGKKLLVGTQNPEAVSEMLRRHPVLV